MAVHSSTVPLNAQASTINLRLPKNNFQRSPEGAGRRTRTAWCEGCLACTSCVHPQGLLTTIAGNHPAVAVELFRKTATRIFDIVSSASLHFFFYSSDDDVVDCR